MKKREPAPTPKWVRGWERGISYHAILGTTMGGKTLVTYCGRIRRASAAGEQVEEPPARCGGCLSKMAHPYLILDQLKASLDGAREVRLVNRPLQPPKGV